MKRLAQFLQYIGISLVTVLLVMVVIMAISAVLTPQPARAAWKTAGWKWGTGDLHSSGSVQVAIDDLDTRLDLVDAGSVDSRKVLLGPDNTTALMAQSTVFTNDLAAHTQSFAVAYTDVPVVVATAGEDPGTGTNYFVSAVASNNFVLSCAETGLLFRAVSLGAK
jgi:hypothetical protein